MSLLIVRLFIYLKEKEKKKNTEFEKKYFWLFCLLLVLTQHALA